VPDPKAASGSTGEAAKSKVGAGVIKQATHVQKAGTAGQSTVGTSQAAPASASSGKTSTSGSSSPADAGAKTLDGISIKDEQTPATCDTFTTCESCGKYYHRIYRSSRPLMKRNSAGKPDPSSKNKKCNFFVPREGPKFGTGVCISGRRQNGILTSSKKECSKIEDEKKARLDAVKLSFFWLSQKHRGLVDRLLDQKACWPIQIKQRRDQPRAKDRRHSQGCGEPYFRF
jgi:hypothetical protein